MIFFGKSDVCATQILVNLEDEIFLKGGSVVTPQNFDLVLLIKILPGNEIFIFWISFNSGPHFSPELWSFHPK